MLGQHVGRYPSSSGHVFTAAEGGPIRERNFYRRHFQPASVAADLSRYDKNGRTKHDEGVCFHDLGHTCASLLVAGAASKRSRSTSATRASVSRRTGTRASTRRRKPRWP